LNQPPHKHRSADWRRPLGVAPGTWEYVQERSIADHYDAFVADTPLCQLDQRLLDNQFPEAPSGLGKTILDLGCGSGRIAIELLKRGHTVVGVDLSQRMLELLVDKATSAGLESRLLAVRSNLVELECLADSSVDAAVCMFSTLGMIQGRVHRRQLLAHTHRITKPGGTIVLHVHHRWAAFWEPAGIQALVKSRLRSLWNRNEDFGDSTYEYRGLSRMFLHRFSRSEVLSDLAATGWTVDQSLAISLDGSRLLETFFEKPFRAGGFFFIAHR
jgi:ubiquinone/menaquinone biosynthesis C-methylase UbiE